MENKNKMQLLNLSFKLISVWIKALVESCHELSLYFSPFTVSFTSSHAVNCSNELGESTFPFDWFNRFFINIHSKHLFYNFQEIKPSQVAAFTFWLISWFYKKNSWFEKHFWLFFKQIFEGISSSEILYLPK